MRLEEATKALCWLRDVRIRNCIKVVRVEPLPYLTGLPTLSPCFHQWRHRSFMSFSSTHVCIYVSRRNILEGARPKATAISECYLLTIIQAAWSFVSRNSGCFEINLPLCLSKNRKFMSRAVRKCALSESDAFSALQSLSDIKAFVISLIQLHKLN